MKYKNINAAIHNLGHSFMSFMNYVDGGYVLDDMAEIHRKDVDITIDWISKKFDPESESTERIRKSMEYYAKSLEADFLALNIELARLNSLKLCWPAAKARVFMEATDDRGKDYRILVRRTN